MTKGKKMYICCPRQDKRKQSLVEREQVSRSGTTSDAHYEQHTTKLGSYIVQRVRESTEARASTVTGNRGTKVIGIPFMLVH